MQMYMGNKVHSTSRQDVLYCAILFLSVEAFVTYNFRKGDITYAIKGLFEGVCVPETLRIPKTLNVQKFRSLLE